MKNSLLYSLLITMVLNSGPSFAQDSAVVDAVPITVRSEPAQGLRQTGLQSEQIYTGKKNTQVVVEEAGPIASNNYRQVATRIPGLTISEVNNESWASITYRGLGDPHESFNLLTLEDGIPVSADIYGYPAAYYQPPMDTVESFEFLRGGSALMHGPQAGGALNYRTRAPGPEVFQSRMRLLGGEYGYAQGFLEASGQTERVEYVVNAHGRRSDGFRTSNGDYEVSGYNLKLGYKVSSNLTLRVKAQDYTGIHGEAGGLARTTGGDALGIDTTRTGTTSPFDRILIDRDLLGLSLQYRASANQSWSADVWQSNMRRSSFRQDYAAGQAQFGTIKAGTTSDITHQYFKTLGAQVKGATQTSVAGAPLNWTYGYRFYTNRNPLENLTGATPEADNGVRELLVENQSRSHSVFTEAELTLGSWSIAPGLRYENIRQEINEQFRSVNVGLPGGGLRSSVLDNNVLLYGLGLEKRLGESRWKLVANSSSGFTPALFAEAFPVAPADQLNGDLTASRILNHEVGLVGEFSQTGVTELSTFYVTNSNQIGRIGNQFTNVGDAEYYGVEGLLILDLIREFTSSSHSLEATFSLSYLESRFVKGPAATIGRTPQYAPQYTARWSLAYLHPNQSSVALTGQWLSQHFADDANTANFNVPSYMVWDLSAQIPTGIKDLNVQVAVRNLFDQQYFARIRSTGIEPGMPRMANLGVSYAF